MARYGFSPATRVFEAAGAGACIITDHFVGVELFLEPGKEILTAHTGDEVAGHVARLTPDRARAIGQAAMRQVLAHHTYAHRAADVEALLDGKLHPMPRTKTETAAKLTPSLTLERSPIAQPVTADTQTI
jgi:spore maturation protein CgeB